MQYIQRYIDKVLGEEIRACEEQVLMCKYVKRVFEEEDIYVDEVKVDKYFGLQKYFLYQLLDWERFCFVLHCCTYRRDGLPRFPDLFIYVGRGSGKNGYTSFEDFCLLSPVNGIRGYDIQAFAAAEDNAKTSFTELHDDVLERNPKKLSKFFKWNLEEITCTKTNSKLTYHTSNPNSKDGARPGKINHDEIHVYKNYELLDVSIGGLGKKKDPRKLFTSTDGKVRDGPLDDYKEKGREILRGERDDNGFLPFMCRLGADEIDDPENWIKAVPSLDDFPNLKNLMRQDYEDYKRDPITHSAFSTKRCNCPHGDIENVITSWDNIQACCRGERPENLGILDGRPCILGVDFAQITDFVGAGLIFLVNQMYYFVHHSWICKDSADLYRVKFPIEQAVLQGDATIVNDSQITPELIARWVIEMVSAHKYRILAGACDSYRFMYLKECFEAALGLKGEARKASNKYGTARGYIYYNRPSDIMKTAPVISTVLENRRLYCGESKIMRWYFNNIKKVLDSDGNTKYEKIEERSRKTDGAMAWIHGMTIHEILKPYGNSSGGNTFIPEVHTY